MLYFPSLVAVFFDYQKTYYETGLCYFMFFISCFICPVTGGKN